MFNDMAGLGVRWGQAEEHKEWYDTLAEAKADRDYEICAWCLGDSTR